MSKTISFEQYKILNRNFSSKVSRYDSYTGETHFIASTPDEWSLDGIMLSYAKGEYEIEIQNIKDAQEWIAQRKTEGLGFDEERMRKNINNARNRKSRAKTRIVQRNVEFEKAIAWAIIYRELEEQKIE